MLNQSRYTEQEYDAMIFYALSKENLADATAARAHKEFFGKTVEVVKGRKVPKGTRGFIFWLNTVKYGYNCFNLQTRIGIKADDGSVFWTTTNNVKIITGAAV